MSKIHLTFGSQLFNPALVQKENPDLVFMCEHSELCTYFRFHKHKIILFLSSMRHYSNELKSLGLKVDYHFLNDHAKSLSFEDILLQACKKNKVSKLSVFEIEDKFMEKRIQLFCDKNKIELHLLRTPMFFVGREDFKKYLSKNKKPFMKTFYEKIRVGTKILMTEKGEPFNGQFSFDDENRLPWKKGLTSPSVNLHTPDSIDLTVMKLVTKEFPDHPGSSENFWIPTSRDETLKWMSQFFKERFKDFGSYEDSITSKEKFLFHSVLSPTMNLGLITPKEVIQAALKAAEKQKIPFNSVEGFVRQILGWREFVRGIYQNYSEKQDVANFWNHKRQMKNTWYTGETGLPPIDDAIKKAIELGYNHHIERLMILANIMNLSELHPNSVHKWFMEMYVDSSDWVMGPNVYGMGLFSDGGIFATKPYISGSNYLIKMSDYKKADWCDEMDGLYWRFIDRHREFFAKNYRLSMMVKLFDKMAADRKEKIDKAAQAFLKRNTTN